jgi:hypothetical protein
MINTPPPPTGKAVICKVFELVLKLLDYALKRMVRKLCLRWNNLEPLALGKSGLIGLKSVPLFPLNLRLLDKHSLSSFILKKFHYPFDNGLVR